MQIIITTVNQWFPRDKEKRWRGMISKAHQDSFEVPVICYMDVATIS